LLKVRAKSNRRMKVLLHRYFGADGADVKNVIFEKIERMTTV
jgi:hypothetical protein